MSNAQLSFYIDGIRCLGCVSQIEKSLEKQLKSRIRVDFSTKTLLIKESERSLLPKMEKTIKQLGFKIIPTNEKALDNLVYQNQKSLLKKLAIAGACTGNIMLFAVPIYAGLQGPLRSSFLWITFFLFIPVLSYSALPFYQGAIASIKTKRINIDLLITIAFGLTTMLSFYHLMSGSDQIYFDSTAAFLFLILSTRYLMEQSRSRLLQPFLFENFIPTDHYETENGFKISAHEIKLQTVFKLKAKQILPVDSESLSSSAAFDSSFIDGISVPKVHAKGSALTSGLRAFENDIWVRAKSTIDDSRLAKFVQGLNKTYLSASYSIERADFWAERLMIIVLSLSGMVIFSGIWFGFEETLRRGTALLVIACPCALAFAAPVTVGTFIRKALRKRIFIKDPAVFDSISEIKSIFIDKTGTLTEEDLLLKNSNPPITSSETREIVLSLEKRSTHSVAYAFRKAWQNTKDDLDFEHWDERVGEGVTGLYKGNSYAIRSLPESTHSEDYAVGLYRNEKLIVEYYFHNQLKQEAASFIEYLKLQNWEIFLLSGDQRSRVESLGKKLGINPSHIHSEAYPEEKAAIVSKFPNSIMLGDGVNDSLAFQKAKFGIAIKGTIDSQFNTSQVSVADSNLKSVIDFIELAKRCNHTLKRNFLIAIVYNFVGAALAIGGFINPLVAAVAMPISSIVILFSTWRGTK